MKRIFALLAALLFSTFSGIEYAAPKDDLFSYGDDFYFQVPKSEEEVQYRQLYQSVYGYTRDSVEKCDTTRRQESRTEWVNIKEHASDFPYGVWDPVYVDGTKATVEVKDSSHLTYTLHGEVHIFAPSPGRINTSHYSCDYGHFMEYVSTLTNGKSYRMTIKDAKCWFCCAHKKTPEDGRYTATTSDSLKGYSMGVGDFLCVGQDGTTVTIEYGVDIGNAGIPDLSQSGSTIAASLPTTSDKSATTTRPTASAQQSASSSSSPTTVPKRRAGGHAAEN